MKLTYKMDRLRETLRELTHKDDVHFLSWVEVNSVLGKFWPQRYSNTEYLVLLFIVNRTLMFRKKAEVISKKHFSNGIESSRGVTCAGAGVGETALNKALKALCDADIINIHCFVEGHVESVPRVYELNVDKILEGYDLGEVQNMLKRSRKALREEAENQRESDDLTPLTSKGGGGREQGGITEVLHTSRKALLTKEQSDGSADPLRVGKGRASDCNERPAPIPGNAKQRLAQIQQDMAAKRATRLHAVKGLPERRWDIRDLQALLDEARSRAGIPVPRIMATAKGAGVLFKRMKDAEVADPLDFFTWALANWGTVANANRRSKAKQMKESKSSSTEMAMIPNFQELAYRFPYILVFYNDRKFTKVQATHQEERRTAERDRRQQDTEVAIDRRRQAVRAQDQAEHDAQKAEDQRFYERRRTLRTRPAPVEDDNDDLPTYREKEWGGQQ